MVHDDSRIREMEEELRIERLRQENRELERGNERLREQLRALHAIYAELERQAALNIHEEVADRITELRRENDERLVTHILIHIAKNVIPI